MPTTLLPGDKKREDERYARNPGDEHEKQVVGNFTDEEKRRMRDQATREGTETADRSKQRQLDNLESRETANDKPSASKGLESQETTPWKTNVTPNQPEKVKGKSTGNRRMKIVVAAMGVFSVGSLLALSFILPLKLLHFITNIEESAAHVGDKAIGNWMTNRLDFYIAARIAATGSDGKVIGNKFDQYVCKSGNIACSMFKGWRLGKIEDKLGIKIESNRTSLNSKATKWKITFEDSGKSVEGGAGDVQGISRELEANSTQEFKQIIRDRTEKVSKWKFSYKRYATRKMLARKYGVRTWTGLLKPIGLDAKVDNALDRKNALFKDIRKRLVKATVSRVNTRNSLYIECLLGGDYDACKEKLRTKETTGAPDPANPQSGEANQAGDAAQVDPEELVVEATADPEAGKAASKVVGKFLTKKVLASAAAGAGLIDLVAAAINATSDGTLTMIQADRAKVAYAGYYTELATSAHAIKFGDINPEAYNALATILTDMEKSPVAQHELGITPDLGTYANPVKRDCNDGNGVQTLHVGKFVCSDKEIVRDIGGFMAFYATPVGQVLTGLATIWKNTGGVVLKFINTVLPFQWISEQLISIIPGLKNGLAELMGGAIDFIFSTPVTGLETGGDAYDATTAGGQVVSDAMLEEGQAADGTGMGMGGAPASPAVLGAYQRDYANERQLAYNKSSLFDKMFNADLQGSVADRFLITAPTNVASLLTRPFAIASSVLSYSPQAKAFQDTGENIFNDTKYAYPLDSNDPAYKVDPLSLTPENCATYAKQRLDSYKKEGNELVPMYHLADPCALEKVGAVAGSNGFTDAYKSDFDLNGGTAAAAATPPQVQSGVPGQTTKLGSGFSLADNTDYTATQCATGSTETQVYTHPIKGFKVRLCKVKSMEIASIISDKVVAMTNAAQGAGIDLNGGGFRTYEQQIAARARNGCPADPTAPSSSCRVPTAPPGTGQHERGLAIDFTAGGGTISKGTAQYKWLTTNAATYSFYNYPAEDWHWSTSGY